MQGLAAVLAPIALARNAWTATADAAQAGTPAQEPGPYEPSLLPAGIRSRFVNAGGLRMHVLEAGFETKGRPAVVLLHGYPELAYSWPR